MNAEQRRKLFQYMHTEHGVNMLESDLDEVEYIILGKEEWLKQVNEPVQTELQKQFKSAIDSVDEQSYYYDSAYGFSFYSKGVRYEIEETDSFLFVTSFYAVVNQGKKIKITKEEYKGIKKYFEAKYFQLKNFTKALRG